MNTTQINADSVRSFYDDFLKTTMLDYRLYPNIRIKRAIKRVSNYVKEDSKVLDIGCGIGIMAEAIAHSAKKGKVWACDISDQNVWYANQTVDLPNVKFKAIDVLHKFDEVKSWIGSPVDLVVMIDVIEHLPLEEHLLFLRKLRGVMAEDACLILTFPSVGYQQYLHTENRDVLQIVDESIGFSLIAKVAADTGFYIKHFSLEDMWMSNQYTHVVLQTRVDVESIAQNKNGLGRKIISRIYNLWESRVLLPKRRKKYINKVFRQR